MSSGWWEARPSCWKSLSGIDFNSGQTASNKLCCISKLSSDMSARQVCFLKVDPLTLHCFPHSKHSSTSLGSHLEYLLICKLQFLTWSVAYPHFGQEYAGAIFNTTSNQSLYGFFSMHESAYRRALFNNKHKKL